MVRDYRSEFYITIGILARWTTRALVMQRMGHRQIKTTMIYTQLLNLNDDEWTCKTATNIREATALIEAGFEYVTEMDSIKIFRKRK